MQSYNYWLNPFWVPVAVDHCKFKFIRGIHEMGGALITVGTFLFFAAAMATHRASQKMRFDWTKFTNRTPIHVHAPLLGNRFLSLWETICDFICLLVSSLPGNAIFDNYLLLIAFLYASSKFMFCCGFANIEYNAKEYLKTYRRCAECVRTSIEQVRTMYASEVIIVVVLQLRFFIIHHQ